LATEKKQKSILYEDHSTFKIEKITNKVGMVYSGMGPDYRVLVKSARKAAHGYKLLYGCDIPTAELVRIKVNVYYIDDIAMQYSKMEIRFKGFTRCHSHARVYSVWGRPSFWRVTPYLWLGFGMK